MNMDFDIKKIYKQLTSPKAANDLIHFFEQLPTKVGTTVIALAGITWIVAGVAVLYGTMQSARIADIRQEYEKVEAMTPPVPKVQNVSVDKESIAAFVAKASDEYKDTGVTIKESGGKISIEGSTGKQYGVFREAVGHIQNGGAGWRVSVEELCVGRGCANRARGSKAFLSGLFAVSRVNIEMPKG